MGGEALRLHEHLMLRAFGEPHHFVFDGRAVAWPDAFDHARVHRRAIEAAADDVVRRRVGVGDMADGLRGVDVRRRQERHHGARFVPRLGVHRAEIHAAAVKARRRAGLQAVHAQRQGAQAFGQRIGRRIARAPAGLVLQADVDAPAEKRARGQDDAIGLEPQAHLRIDAANPVILDVEVHYRLLEDGEIGLRFHEVAHRVPVKHAIGLCPRRPHRRPFAPVQRAEVDARPVGGERHRTAQGVDLAHQVRLADAADSGVAGHLADGLDAHRQKQRPGPDAGGRECCLGAGVAAADDDDIEAFGVVHGARPCRLLPGLGQRASDYTPASAAGHGSRPASRRPSGLSAATGPGSGSCCPGTLWRNAQAGARLA